MNTTTSTSEKYIERALVEAVEKKGGKALKFYSATQTGYPDRVVMLPQGRIAWVELKSKGKKPTKLQTIRHEELRALGFQVAVIDNADDARQFPERMVANEL